MARLRLSSPVAAAAVLLGLALGAAGATTPAHAAPTLTERGADLCDQAIRVAAEKHGAPERLLRALSRVETGRRIGGARRAWPWTVNAAGDGRWFSTRDEARRFAEDALARGVRSIDLGCLQINRIWHGDAFRNLNDMLDPMRNADYAARYLKALMQETGDWMRAAGYYHSRTPQHFNRYSALVRAAYAAERVDGAPQPGSPAAPTAVAVAAAAPAPPPPAGGWDGLLRRAKARALAFGALDAATPPAPRGGVALSFNAGGAPLLTPRGAAPDGPPPNTRAAAPGAVFLGPLATPLTSLGDPR